MECLFAVSIFRDSPSGADTVPGRSGDGNSKSFCLLHVGNFNVDSIK